MEKTNKTEEAKKRPPESTLGVRKAVLSARKHTVRSEAKSGTGLKTLPNASFRNINKS